MLVGSNNVQEDLFKTFLKYREHAIVLSADFEKMNRQVLVRKEQILLQKMPWRFSTDKSISVYELNTVNYGFASNY